MPRMSSSASALAPTRRAAAMRCSAWRATSRITAASRSTRSATPGRCTFTTTRSPVTSVARWVWPIDAAASGSKSNSANACLDRLVERATRSPRGRRRRRSAARSTAASRARVVRVSGRRSVRVDAIWPNFTIIPPASSIVRRRRRAKSAVSTACSDRYRTCTQVVVAGVADQLAHATDRRERVLRRADRVEQRAAEPVPRARSRVERVMRSSTIAAGIATMTPKKSVIGTTTQRRLVLVDDQRRAQDAADPADDRDDGRPPPAEARCRAPASTASPPPRSTGR